MDGWLLSSSFFQPCAYLPAKTTIFNLAKFIKSAGLLGRSAVNEAGPTASQSFYWSDLQLCTGVAKRKSSRRYAFVAPRDTENLRQWHRLSVEPYYRTAEFHRQLFQRDSSHSSINTPSMAPLVRFSAAAAEVLARNVPLPSLGRQSGPAIL
jgi:hypothetical protein